MVEAEPPASFKVTQPDLLLEVLIVALDAPAQLGGLNQIAEWDALRQGREPGFARLILAGGPLDQQPLLPRVGRTLVARCNMDPHSGKTRAQPFVRAFPPRNRVPCFRPQPQGNVLDRDRIGGVAPALPGRSLA